MKVNIPIYRAKKIDSDEYVLGTGTTDFLNVNQYKQFQGEGRIWLWSNYSWIEIDPLTLAIHFKDMLDCDNKKIFASLDSDNGIGGDRLFGDLYKVPMPVVYTNGAFEIKGRDNVMKILSVANLKVIGIQK